MKKYLILLFLFILALLQGAFWKINLVLLAVLLWAGVCRNTKQIFWLAFTAGLFLDLAAGYRLGGSSLFFFIEKGLYCFVTQNSCTCHSKCYNVFNTVEDRGKFASK